MDQFQIDADNHNTLPPMTIDNPESQDPGSDSEQIEIDQDSGSDCGTPRAGSVSEHFKIDQDSVSDCELAPEDLFGDFTANGMMTRVKGLERESIVKHFVSGMGAAGKETKVVAVHRNLSSGLTRKARFQAFRIFTDAMVRKCRNPNIKHGCFGGTKEEIAEILAHGFSARNEAVRGRIHLVPMSFTVDAAVKCGVDEEGMRHVLVCRVIMGKSELMPEGFFGNGPSSSEFDSGVDSLLNPRKYIVWSTSMNSHILPAYVVSFKAPGCLEKYVAPPPKVYNFVDMLPLLARFVSPEKMAVLYKLRDNYKEKKISLGDLNGKLKKKVGKKAMDSAMKLMESGKGCAGPPALGKFNLMQVLLRLLPASKLAALAKLRNDFRGKRICPVEFSRGVGLLVGSKVFAAVIKLTKPGGSALVEAALAKLLSPSQLKTVTGLIKDHSAKKISRTEFGQRYRLIVDSMTTDAAIELAIQSITGGDASQQRSITASDVRLNMPNSSISISDLMPFLERSLSSQKMALLTKSIEDFHAKKISRDQMNQRAKIIIGRECFASAIKSYRSGQQNV